MIGRDRTQRGRTSSEIREVGDTPILLRFSFGPFPLGETIIVEILFSVVLEPD